LEQDKVEEPTPLLVDTILILMCLKHLEVEAEVGIIIKQDLMGDLEAELLEIH
jgi:hypothetical protein